MKNFILSFQRKWEFSKYKIKNILNNIAEASYKTFMRILWFTWKDKTHPLAGGAEVVASELGKRLVSDGHEVVFIVGGYKKNKKARSKEIIDGYTVIRVGGRWSVYWQAYRYYKKHLRGWADVVIDEMNTMPFFTKYYITKNKNTPTCHSRERRNPKDKKDTPCHSRKSRNPEYEENTFCHSRKSRNSEHEEATSCHSRAGGNPENKDVVKNQKKSFCHNHEAENSQNKNPRQFLFVHQLCREIWFYQMFFPLNIIGYVLEFFYLRLLNDQEVITVSESTKKDLMRYGFKKDRIHIISEGIQCEPLAQLPAIHHAKYDTPTILSLGAVRAMKRADHIVTAFNILKSTSSHSHKNLSHLHDNSCHSRAGENPEYEEATSCHSRAGGNPGNKDVVKNQQKTCQSIHKNNNLKYKQQIKNAKLIIAGDIHDPYAQKVLHNVAKSPYKNDITVLGRVSTEKKWELMQKSHLIAVTSIKEGWGLIVTEAASQGTPAVVYDVDGLRDAVEWGDAGYMTKDNTPKALANEMIQALQDEDKYERIRQYAWHKSQKLTFEKSYKDFFL